MSSTPRQTVPAAEEVDAPPRPLYRNPWLWAFVLGLVVIPLLRPLFRHEPAPPPVLWPVPAFSLVDQSGKAVDKQALQGRVWVAFFFFTHCKSICPRLMKSMVALQQRYDRWKNKDIRLVGVSVDPQNDRPARLSRYLDQYGGDRSRFLLLTSSDGSDAGPRALIVGGFKNHVGVRQKKGDIVDIAHSGKVVLVDRQGRIRGFYDTDEKGLDEAFHRSLQVWLRGR